MTVRTYRLRRPGPKHFRWEDKHGAPVTKTVHRPKNRMGLNAEGKPAMIEGEYFAPVEGVTLVAYGVGEGLKNLIKLDDSDLHKFAHFNPELYVEGASTPAATPVATNTAERINIPADWDQLAAADRKALATRILGEPVTTAKEADVIIQGYIDGSDSDAD